MFYYGCMFAFVALDLVFPYKAKRLAGKNVSEMTHFRWVGCKTITQSVSHVAATKQLYYVHYAGQPGLAGTPS